jgi:hypothetical protein
MLHRKSINVLYQLIQYVAQHTRVVRADKDFAV